MYSYRREFDNIEDIFKLVKTQLRKTYVIEPFDEDKVSIKELDELIPNSTYEEIIKG